jgi:site-specific DNA-methyltransferase (adenine-specific)
MDYMRSLPDKAFDLAVVDPPYGISVDRQALGEGTGLAPKTNTIKLIKSRMQGGGKLKDRVLNRSDTGWDYSPPGQEYFAELFRVSKNQVIWGGNYFQLPPTRGIICWDKEQTFPNFSQWEMAWTSMDFPAKIFRFCNRGFLNQEKEEKFHPTQKPVALYTWIYETFAKPGDRILDTHLGSGSSRIAAYDAGLDFVGCEIDETYFKLQEQRFERHSAQLNLFLEEGKL